MNEPSNPFAIAAAQAGGAIQVAQSKEAQQIQAQLVIAKKYPRDQNMAYQQIMEACKRKGLAEEASYLYSRGGAQISGASIRLLEVICGQWGNFRSGVIELDQENGESRMEAFAWDLQNNTYESKTFTIRHERYTKNGMVKLDDPRDQYEHVANFAARRKRACMEAIIPRDIIDDALEQCDKTLKAGHSEPLADRVRKMVTVFAEYGITVPMIEKRLQHKLEVCIEQELILLRKIFTSLKDGMSKREDWFDVNAGVEIARPKFDDAKATAAEEKAEAAAGLAPEPPSQPKRGRPKKVAAEAQPEAPAATPAPQPAQQSAQSQPTAPAAPVTAPAQPSFAALASEPYNQLRQLMEHSQITDVELIRLCKHRGLMTAQQVELLQLSDEKIKDLCESWQTVAAQVRIDRRSQKVPG